MSWNIWGYSLLFFIFSCTAPNITSQTYLYSSENSDEVFRICKYVRKWGKRGFTVIGNKAHIIDPPVAPLLYLEHPLPEGYHQCGRVDVGKVPCAKGAIRTLNNERCSF